MPELPEVVTLKKGLEKTILGKKIAGVEVRLPKIVSLGPKAVSNIRTHSPRTVRIFRGLLAGQKIRAIKRRAKMLIIELSPEVSLPRLAPHLSSSTKWGGIEGEGKLVLLIHLKMTGQLIYARKGERKAVKIFNSANSPTAVLPHKYTHVIFTFSDGAKLFFNDLRQFGYLRLVKDEDVKNVRELAEYGPEPLSKDFTLDYLKQKAKSRQKLSVKQFLTEPKVLSGIGNIYSDEILYCAKIRPNRRVRALSKPDFQAIYKCAPRILKKAIKAQGSSVGDFFKVDGSEGTFGRQHMVYGRYGRPCKTCGGIIKKIKLGGRTSSYCLHCQR